MVIFGELMARIAGRFGRVKPRRTPRAHARGLLGPDGVLVADETGFVNRGTLK